MTAGGRFLLLGTFFAGAAGSLTLFVPIYHVFCAFMFLYVVSLLCGLLLRPKFSVKGQLPEKASAGQTISAEFSVENRSHLPVYDLALGFFELPSSLEEVDPGKAVPHVGAGKSLSLALKLHPRKRGFYVMPKMKVYTTFPFNLWRTVRASHRVGPLLVLPGFHPIVHLDVPVGLRYQPGGIALSSNVGESPEYIGTREYRPGDSTRRIDFKSWARLAKPAVKEYRGEYYCRIALVLDTFVAPGRRKGRNGFPEVEAAVSLSASIADALSRGEYIVDIFAVGPDLYVFRAGRNIAHFDNILEILACVEECRANPLNTIAPVLADELANITTVIYVLLDWDSTRENFVRSAIEAGCKTKVLIVHDGETRENFAHAEDWAGAIFHFTPEQVKSGGIESI